MHRRHHHRQGRTRVRLTAALLGAGLLLAACGGDETAAVIGSSDAGDITTDSASDSGSDSAVDATTTAGTEADADADAGDSTAAASSDPDGAPTGSGDGSAFCETIQRQQDDLTGPDSPLMKLDDLGSYFQATTDMWDELQAVAPPELVDSLAVGRAASAEMADRSSDGLDLEALFELGSDPEYTTAAAEVADYARDRCGLDPGLLFGL